MTIRTNILTDGSIVVELDTTEDWGKFAADNYDAVLEQYGSFEHASWVLCDGGLLLGGGASPEVGVYYAE